MVVPDLATIALLVLSLALAHGANARFARVFTEDDITVKWRNWVGKRYGHSSKPYKLINCPWCLGFWTAWPIAALAWFPIMGWAYWWMFLLGGWSVAHAAGRLNHNHGN